jgi:DNA-binding transcriptional ArsR family regulator
MDTNLREEIYQLHAEICGGLADPNRILILYALFDKPHYVSQLAEALNMPQSTCSRHLKVLRDRGMVLAQRDGAQVIYSIGDQRIIMALDLLRAVLADHLSEQAALAVSVNGQLSS